MTPLSSRSLVPALIVIAVVLSIISPVASAQTTYEWNGDGAGTTNPLPWDGTTSGLSSFWEDLTAPADPAATPPGSNLNGGALDDLVIIRNARPVTGGGAQQTAQVRLEVDAGTVDSVRVGGYKDATASGAAIAPPAGGNWVTQLDLRTSGNLIITNDLTLGEVDVDRERAGQLQFLPNNNGALLTVGGNIVSGSTDSQNRIIIRGPGAGGLDLTGNIDTGTTGGSAGGTREIDLRIESDIDADPFRFFLFTGGQTLSVDDFWIGERFNGNATGAFTLDEANVVEANLVRIGSTAGNTNNGPPRSATGSLTINNAGSSVDSFGGNGENGNIQVGAALGNYDDTQSATGTLTVTSGRIGATNALDLGIITRNADALAGDRSATGTVTLDAAGVTHLIGRVDGTGGNANQLSGVVNVGREGTGTLNLNAGTLAVYGSAYAGGDNPDGRDRASSGTITVGPGASLLVKDVDPSSALVLTTDGTTARDQSVTVGAGNLEVGRDGVGTLNVDGGTIVIGQANLVLGQDSPVAVNGVFDGNMDGTTDDIVGLNINFDIFDDKGAWVISTDPADGDIVEDGAPDPDLAVNYILTAQGEEKLLPNVARGTVNLTNGASVTIGGTYTATTGNPEATPDGDLNFNGGGGDMLVDASTLDVADNIAMGPVGPTNARNSLTIRNGSTVTVGSRDSVDAGDLAGQASDITITGANTISIADDLLLNASSDLTLDFGGTFLNDFGIVIDDNASLNNAELIIAGTSVLAAENTNVLLLNAASSTGSFSNLDEDQFVAVGAGGFYRFTYELGGVPGQIGLEFVVPPPASTYNWLGDGAGGNNLSWTDTMIKWEDVDNVLNPASNPPGGFAGGNDADTVIITNTRAGAGTETVRINNLNVGTVTDLTVGGGTQTTALQVRGDGGVITIGNLTLGAGGVGGVAGQLLVNNGGSSATVTGDVISASDHPGNRLVVGDNASGGLT
ncbi:MAG: hypothetical protein HKO57_05705, partial [Akkermansiaceae bacterium]|nr:hypothetical protein [Akkermansiaceae bacterium]